MRLGTKSLHAGQKPDPTTGSRAVPIYQTTSYQFRDSEHAANLFGLKELGNIYTRIMNPTTDVLEQRLAALEGGSGAAAHASGQAAITAAILNIAGAGDHVVSVCAALRRHLQSLPLHPPEASASRSRSSTATIRRTSAMAVEEEHQGLLRRRSRQPAPQRLPLRRSRQDRQGGRRPADHRQHRPFARTSTARSSIGADIVVHSATKHIGGHGTSIGGIVVDGGNFDWGQRPVPRLHRARHVLPRPAALGGLQGLPARAAPTSPSS
jgi:O-acetylhomoserine (thiol)-lyase